jgi:hypothetical protein
MDFAPGIGQQHAVVVALEQALAVEPLQIADLLAEPPARAAASNALSALRGGSFKASPELDNLSLSQN